LGGCVGWVGGEQKDDHRHLNQFVVHAALDVIDELVWTTNSMYVGSSASGIIENYNADGRYLKVVDKFNEWFISAYICASSTLSLGFSYSLCARIDVKLMLLHDSRNEDNIKNFFQEIHELYIKVLMNPLQEQDGAIESKAFDQKVRAIGRKYL